MNRPSLVACLFLFSAQAALAAPISLDDYLQQEGIDAKLLAPKGRAMEELKRLHAQADGGQGDADLRAKLREVKEAVALFKELEEEAIEIERLRGRQSIPAARERGEEFLEKLTSHRPKLRTVIKPEELTRLKEAGRPPTPSEEYFWAYNKPIFFA